MTRTDRHHTLAGYYPSAWPVECGGNRRQKAASGGLRAASARPQLVSVRNGRWNVMLIQRGVGELFLGGTTAAFRGAAPFGWLQRLHPQNLEVMAESPRLPCGDHVWCGSIAAHENGDIIMVNGSFMHRLDAECQIIAERQLPIDRAHNGLLVLSDGSILTKDLRLAGQGSTSITRLRPDGLELLGTPLVLPEGSMGRIASDLTEEGEFVYIPGTEHIWRLKVEPERLLLDESWSPRYRREGDEQGLAWDGCISGDALWLMDNGDVDSVRAIFGQFPNGRFDGPTDRLSWRRPAPWRGPQRLLRIGLADGRLDAISPFASAGGGIIAPPVYVPEHNMCIAWDSINGGLVGIRYAAGDTTGALQVAWRVDARPTMQPVVFPDTGELVINDYQDNADSLIVVDVRSGQILSRAETGSQLANGMFLTPGWDRDIYYCSTLVVSRVQWR